jgi:glutaminyl-tRNA synthetase
MAEATNFLVERIEADLARGTYQGRVVTRFPPEPNGYLHIGHAKAIVTDFGLAKRYGGRCHLRFDDTNPLVEDTEYVDAIQHDVRWLGYDWGEHLYYASDYFGRLYEFAERLIREGKAYVCSLTDDEVRERRGTVTEPGQPSPDRERPAEESLRLLQEMRDGHLPDVRLRPRPFRRH